MCERNLRKKEFFQQKWKDPHCEKQKDRSRRICQTHFWCPWSNEILYVWTLWICIYILNTYCLKKKEDRTKWRQSLGIVSHTTDSLYEDLSKTFHDTKYQFLEEHRIFLWSKVRGTDSHWRKTLCSTNIRRSRAQFVAKYLVILRFFMTVRTSF